MPPPPTISVAKALLSCHSSDSRSLNVRSVVHPSVHLLDAMSVYLVGGILIKFATNIHHVMGIAGKVLGSESKVKITCTNV